MEQLANERLRLAQETRAATIGSRLQEGTKVPLILIVFDYAGGEYSNLSWKTGHASKAATLEAIECVLDRWASPERIWELAATVTDEQKATMLPAPMFRGLLENIRTQLPEAEGFALFAGLAPLTQYGSSGVREDMIELLNGLVDHFRGKDSTHGG